MATPEERWTEAREAAIKFQKDLLSASGGVENTSSAIQTVCEEDKKPWACDLHDYMIENIHAEPIDIIEEKVRLNVIPPIEENRPPGLGMTSSEKSYAHSRVTYIKSHLDKLEATAVNAPKVLDETTKIRGNLETLSTQITTDPRARHPSIGSHHKGLTVRQRRRLRRA